MIFAIHRTHVGRRERLFTASLHELASVVSETLCLRVIVALLYDAVFWSPQSQFRFEAESSDRLSENHRRVSAGIGRLLSQTSQATPHTFFLS